MADGQVDGVVVDGATGARRPVVRRPGRATRAVTYPAFRSYDGATVRPGTRPIWLYLRLSRYHRDGWDAIERQRIDLTRKLDAEGCWTIMGEYVDNDSASASAARNRKGWHALNAAIDAGQVTAVAFWKLDRTNRIAARCIEWIAHCQAQRVMLVSHQDSSDELNTATAGAKLVSGIKALLAEVETDTMSERQRSAKRHTAEAGFHHGGMLPFGWMSGPREVDELGRRGVRLVAHPVEFAASEAAVAMVLEGKSLSDIADRWRAEFGITAADGGRMSQASIRRFLVSPRMIGYRMRQVPEHQRGVKINLLDYVALDANGDPVISQPPVCDRPTWLRMVRELEARSTAKAATRQPWGAHGWLLTGLVHCGTCGGRLYGHEAAHRRVDGTVVRRYAYQCQANRRHGAGTCAQPARVPAEQAEVFVTGWLFAFLTDDRLAKVRAEQAARQAATPTGSLLAELDETRAERDTLIAQQDGGTYKGKMVAVLLGMIADVQERVDKLEAQLDTATVIEGLPVASHADLARQWPDMTLAQRRRLLARVIDRIDVTADHQLPVEDRVCVRPHPQLGPADRPIDDRDQIPGHLIRQRPAATAARRPASQPAT
ncbi:recombinase [Pseudofrankia sp. BMG5.36]|nr:recombinase [Pseudofrankia sp. BMG5.36]